jgi:hypothetical protein
MKSARNCRGRQNNQRRNVTKIYRFHEGILNQIATSRYGQNEKDLLQSKDAVTFQPIAQHNPRPNHQQEWQEAPNGDPLGSIKVPEPARNEHRYGYSENTYNAKDLCEPWFGQERGADQN